MADQKSEPPRPEGRDTVYSVVRAAIAAVPLVGGPALELIGEVITPPLERRQHEWLTALAADVDALKKAHNIRVEDLRDNPVFIDAVLTASQVALRTSQRQKHDALRNGVLNSALPNRPDEVSQQVFLAFMDRFTELHLKILKLFHLPLQWQAPDGRRVTNRHTGLAASVLEEAYPELKDQRPLYQQVWRDLYNAGLVRLETLENQGEGEGVMKKRTTSLGDQFVAFITSPLPKPT